TMCKPSVIEYKKESSVNPNPLTGASVKAA
ncbi:MAG: hypothetical protein ACJAZF_005069, partial [Granulosicoccus sp.]